MSYLDEYDAYLSKGPLNPSGGKTSPLGNYSNAIIYNPVSESVQAPSIQSGSQTQPLFAGKTSFADPADGYWWGFDPISHQFKWIVGASGSSVDFNVTSPGTFTINVPLVAVNVQYGKTSFPDSTHAGYYISSSGVYFGAAADSTYLKYDIGAATLAYVGTISGRSTATIASAINASGNLVTDVVNARLDSSSKAILSDFSFGASDYAGAVKSGTITWNPTTGAITGGSGVVVYRGGIIGASSGAATFTLDAATGSATFAGTLSAAGGTLGTITSGTITGAVLNYGKTSFSDSANSGYYISSPGMYFGSASDSTYLKLSLGSTATDQSQNPSITSNIPIGDATGYKACIKYVCGTTGKLYSIASKFYKSGTGIQDDLIYTIQTDSAGTPSGTVLETITVPKATVNAWTPNDVFHEILAAGTTDVTSGTTYWIVVDCNARDAGNFVYFRYNNGSVAGWAGVRDYSSGTWHTAGYADTQAPNAVKVTGSSSMVLSGTSVSFAIGSGNSVFKADPNGIYLGNATFASAPFSVDMSGNVIANKIMASNLCAAFFGDDSDGDVTLGAGTTTLTRDIAYGTLTIPVGSILETNGYRVYARTLINNGTIRRNGNNGGNATGGTAGTGGAALADGTLRGSVSGGAGSAGALGGSSPPSAPPAPAAVTASLTSNAGRTGGNGGNGVRNNGATGATGGAVTLTKTIPLTASLSALNMEFTSGSAPVFNIAGGTSGGGGGGGAGNGAGEDGGGGGGAGSNGGVMFISCPNIVNNGSIEAKGGNGGNGYGGQANAGDGGGGSGGNGGYIIIVTRFYTGNLPVVTGGAKGLTQSLGIGTPGTDGQAGADGVCKFQYI